jgi:hypothetical protein
MSRAVLPAAALFPAVVRIIRAEAFVDNALPHHRTEATIAAKNRRPQHTGTAAMTAASVPRRRTVIGTTTESPRWDIQKRLTPAADATIVVPKDNHPGRVPTDHLAGTTPGVASATAAEIRAVGPDRL